MADQPGLDMESAREAFESSQDFTLGLEEEGRRLLAAVGPVPAATVDQGHGPSNAAEARQPR